MRVQLKDNTELVIRFRREDTFKTYAIYGPYNRKYSVPMFNGVRTYCFGKVNGETVFEGSARHHEQDIFTKAEGRRRALDKALQNSNLSTEDRAIVWAQYFHEHTDLEK